jgi:hypothetical protein
MQISNDQNLPYFLICCFGFCALLILICFACPVKYEKLFINNPASVVSAAECLLQAMCSQNRQSHNQKLFADTAVSCCVFTIDTQVVYSYILIIQKQVLIKK